MARYFPGLCGILQDVTVSDKLSALYFQGNCFKSRSEYRLLDCSLSWLC